MTQPKKPISIMWETTIQCGLKCKHCKASAKTRPDPDELTTQEGYSLIDQIAEFGSPYPILRLTGGNALMRPDIFHLIKYSKEKGITTTIAPSTTPLLNRENIMKLKEVGCDTVAMSIDGATAERHDTFRGVPGTFHQLVEATKIMKEIDLPFRLLTTVSKFNVRELPEIMMLANELGAIGWYLYMLIPTGRAREEYEISPEGFEDVFNFVYDLMMKSPITVNAIAGSEPYRRVAVTRKLIEDGLLDESVQMKGELYEYLKGRMDELAGDIPSKESEPSRKHKMGDSSIFGKGIFISRNGTVMPSSFLPIQLGNVRTGTIKEMYENASILKDLHESKMLKGRCGRCDFNEICRGSRSRAYAVTGDYLAEDPYCVYEPGSIDTGNYDIKEILTRIRVTNFSRRVS